MRIFVFLCVFGLALSLLLAPAFSSAQGLVPCGGEGQPDCQLCHIFVLIDNILDFTLTVFVPIVAVLLIAFGGFMFLTSAGDPGRQSTGRNIITAVVVGFVIIFSAWIVVNFLFSFFGITSWGGAGEWWQVECSSTSSIDRGDTARDERSDEEDDSDTGSTPPPPPPTVSLSANPDSITTGSNTALTWAVTNSTSCIASSTPINHWSGSKSASGGSELVTPPSPASFTYTLQCTGPGGTASDTASVIVTAPITKKVFITKGTYLIASDPFGTGLPTILGLSGADARCQQAASAAGLTGTFKAWLSDATGSPSTRFTKASGPYALVNGTKIANNWNDLTDGSLLSPINAYEDGTPYTGLLVPTATNPNGTLVNGNHCSNWTATSGGRPQVGNPSTTDSRWTSDPLQSTISSCNMLLKLYCVEQ